MSERDEVLKHLKGINNYEEKKFQNFSEERKARVPKIEEEWKLSQEDYDELYNQDMILPEEQYESYGGEFEYCNLTPQTVLSRLANATDEVEIEKLKIAQRFWAMKGAYQGSEQEIDWGGGVTRPFSGLDIFGDRDGDTEKK